ncbi:MAG: hypothetical protein ACREQZ_05555 [Woeseiaceae bacterium]
MNTTAQSSGEPGSTLLYVHGRDFKPPAAELMDVSVSALTAGLERDRPEAVEPFRALDKQICYYGDLSNRFLLDAGGDYDEQLDISDRRNAVQKLRSLDKRKHFGVARYDRLPGKTAMAEFAADIAAPLLGSLGLSKKLISGVAEDLGEYWNADSAFASALQQRIRQPLAGALARGDRVLLISHGTGNVVAWDVLWQLSHDPQYAERHAAHKIDTWLTLGAPLGDSMVRRRILGAKRRGRERFPTNIVTWQNVSAEDDYLCHDNTLADDFRAMLKQRQVSSIRDYGIYNLAVRYGKSNPHCSIGYLIHPRTAQIVADWLLNRPSGRAPTGTP